MFPRVRFVTYWILLAGHHSRGMLTSVGRKQVRNSALWHLKHEKFDLMFHTSHPLALESAETALEMFDTPVLPKIEAHSGLCPEFEEDSFPKIARFPLYLRALQNVRGGTETVQDLLRFWPTGWAHFGAVCATLVQIAKEAWSRPPRFSPVTRHVFLCVENPATIAVLLPQATLLGSLRQGDVVALHAALHQENEFDLRRAEILCRPERDSSSFEEN